MSASEFNPLSGDEAAQAAERLKFDANGLVTATAVDSVTGELLMLAHMNREAFLLTLETGRMTYWSRSRKELWIKGETSGNTQKVVSAHVDCDGDALMFKVIPEGLGAACHEGYRSCFFRNLEDGKWKVQGKPLDPSKPVLE